VRGSKPLGAGRPPGALNKTTRHLKEAILRAAEEVGGEEGLTGYLKMLAVQNTLHLRRCWAKCCRRSWLLMRIAD
jgi:hypothetical protein